MSEGDSGSKEETSRKRTKQDSNSVPSTKVQLQVHAIVNLVVGEGNVVLVNVVPIRMTSFSHACCAYGGRIRRYGEFPR